MKAVLPDAIRDVLLLSIAAGSADALAFLALGHVFTCNMTGNVVLLGIDLGQGHGAEAAWSFYVLVIFMLGVALGARLCRHIADEDWPRLAARLIALEKVLLLVFALGWTFAPRAAEPWQGVLVALLAVAMALQSVAWTRLRAPGVGTTAITGTIVAFATELIELALPGSGETRGARASFQAGVVALYCLGGAVSGLLLFHLPWLAGWVPVAVALLVTYGRKPTERIGNKALRG
jgi:uncharacterized membrane protein YoaK (UPF0700 family)